MSTKHESSLLHNRLVPVVVAAVCTFFLAGPQPSWADPAASPTAGDHGRASVSRGSSHSGSSGGRASVSRSSGGGGRAAATRPSGGSGGGGRTAVHRPSGSSSRRGHGFHGHFGFNGRAFYPFFDFGFGFYRYPYYLAYGYPYGYPYGSPYGPYGYGYAGPRWYDYPASPSLGGVDLNIKPKKAQVYIDGQLIGKVGRFDGYPGVLWLEEGTYDLVIYEPGYQTLHQTVKVFPGAVIHLDQRMAEGVATPPEEIVPPPTAPASSPAPASGPSRRLAAVEPRSAPRDVPRDMDLRHDPGRIHLTVEPSDASVYLDGRFLGTGAELESLQAGLMVNPGDHLLSVVRPSFESEELTLEVAAGQDLEMVVQLRPSRGSL